MRLGVLTHYVTEDMEAPVAVAFDAALKHLEAAGAILADVRFGPLERLPEINRFGFSAMEAYAWHRPFIAAHRDKYDPRVLVRILKGESRQRSDYLDLLAQRAALMEAAHATLWQHFDAIVAPTVPIVPPRLADCDRDDAAYTRINSLSCATPASSTCSTPARISLPCHEHGEAPVGLMLAAAPHHDDALLGAALAVERVLVSSR